MRIMIPVCETGSSGYSGSNRASPDPKSGGSPPTLYPVNGERSAWLSYREPRKVPWKDLNLRPLPSSETPESDRVYPRPERGGLPSSSSQMGYFFFASGHGHLFPHLHHAVPSRDAPYFS
jgi:hypothetical protein